MGISTALQSHLDTGATTICRAWLLRRRDGETLGFTDHDSDLMIDGLLYRASTGLTAQALQQTTGMAVDNTEAIGALQDAAITESDIAAGRYDGAEVETWLVNWRDTDQRSLTFRGTIGEIQYGGGAFQAELRGLSEALNVPRNRVFQEMCQTGLGSAPCGIDLTQPEVSALVTVVEAVSRTALRVSDLSGYDENWFARGRFEMRTGAAAGLSGIVKFDKRISSEAEVHFWEDLREEILPGDTLLLQAGCDKSKDTCRDKFANILNFQGFQHIPGDDWMMAYPVRSGTNDGGSRS